MEDWPSGRRRMFGVHVYGQPYLGFESLIFRTQKHRAKSDFVFFYFLEYLKCGKRSYQ